MINIHQLRPTSWRPCAIWPRFVPCNRVGDGLLTSSVMSKLHLLQSLYNYVSSHTIDYIKKELFRYLSDLVYIDIWVINACLRPTSSNILTFVTCERWLHLDLVIFRWLPVEWCGHYPKPLFYPRCGYTIKIIRELSKIGNSVNFLTETPPWKSVKRPWKNPKRPWKYREFRENGNSQNRYKRYMSEEWVVHFQSFLLDLLRSWISQHGWLISTSVSSFRVGMEQTIGCDDSYGPGQEISLHCLGIGVGTTFSS